MRSVLLIASATFVIFALLLSIGVVFSSNPISGNMREMVEKTTNSYIEGLATISKSAQVVVKVRGFPG